MSNTGIDKNKNYENFEKVSPPVDIIENNDSYIIYADMPGIDLDKLNIELDRETLLVEALTVENSLPSLGYERRFRVMRGLDPNSVTAEYKNGVLKISLAKPADAIPKKIKVNVE